jgi:hypothetical protein
VESLREKDFAPSLAYTINGRAALQFQGPKLARKARRSMISSPREAGNSRGMTIEAGSTAAARIKQLPDRQTRTHRGCGSPFNHGDNRRGR